MLSARETAQGVTFNNQHLQKCEELLRKGRKSYIKSLADGPLEKREVVSPLSVLTMIMTTLFNDVTDAKPDVVQIYEEYLRQIVSS
jgi:hypothetical protein